MAGIISVDSLKGLGDIVPGIAKGVSDLANGIRTAITGVDASKQADLLAKLTELDAAAQNAQAEIDKVEAASSSKFVAGWRPGLGWLIVAAMAMKYVLYPLASWIAALFGATLPPFPVDDAALYPLIVGLLGLGTMRTVEKVQGAQGNH